MKSLFKCKRTYLIPRYPNTCFYLKTLVLEWEKENEK